jgi:CMP-N-acetylneuraminic acid synthetase
LAFRLNGALYLVRRAEIEERGTLVPEAALPLVLPPERSLNIDHPFDLVLAEALLERGLVALESD